MNKTILTTIIAITVLSIGLSPAFAGHTAPYTGTDGHCLDSPAPGVDWSHCDLSFANLSGANLSGANLSGASIGSLGGVICGAGTTESAPDAVGIKTCTANAGTPVTCGAGTEPNGAGDGCVLTQQTTDDLAALVTCTASLNTCTTNLGTATTSLNTCNANLGTATTSLNTCNADNASLQSNTDNLNNVVIPGLNQQISDQTTTITNLNGQIASLNGQIASMNGQITTLQNDNALLEQMKTQLESDLLAAQTALSTAQADLTTAQTTIAQLDSIITGQSEAEICHKPGTNKQSTIQVSVQALQGHLNHGDTFGACAS